MSSSEVFSLALSAGFGLVSTIGVIYQIKDIRNKPGKAEAPVPVAVGVGGPSVPVGPPPGPGLLASPVPYQAGPGLYPVPPTPPAYPVGPPTSAPPLSSPLPGHPLPGQPLSSPPTSPAVPGYLAPHAPAYPMSPAAGPHAAPPAYPLSASTVPTGAAAPGVMMLAQPQPPKSIARVRLILLGITILMIPNVALWMYSSILGGAYADESFDDPVTYLSIIGAMLILVIPLGTVPTVLSWQIGRGRNWARIVATVLFVMVGPFCSCFGVFLPFSSLGTQGSVSTSPLMDTGLGIFSLALGVTAILVVVNLFLPTANRFFRDMTQWRAARAAVVNRT